MLIEKGRAYTSKRIRQFSVFIAAAVLCVSICGCAQPEGDQASHDALISEIGEMNRVRHEKRQKFLDSEIHQKAEKYIINAIENIYPDCEYKLSIEPGSLWENDLTEFSDFSDNDDTKQHFFHEADVYVSVNFRDYGDEGMDAGNKLLKYQISCRLAADEYGEDCYVIDAEEGTVVFDPMPGV